MNLFRSETKDNPDRISRNIVDFTVKLSESMEKGAVVKMNTVSSAIDLISGQNEFDLTTYLGMFALYWSKTFGGHPPGEYPPDLFNHKIFVLGQEIFDGDIETGEKIPEAFHSIMTIPENERRLRNLLLGCLYLSAWKFFEKYKHNERITGIGIKLIEKLFSIDKVDLKKKIRLDLKGKLITMAGSGKKTPGNKLINLSSMAAITTVAASALAKNPVYVAKTVSRATSSMTGSYDIFEMVGTNMNNDFQKMNGILNRCGLGVYDVNSIVPKLNGAYDGKLYNIQVFAGLLGGAAVVNPLKPDLINYGLTRGEQLTTLNVLKALYPECDIMIISGQDVNSAPAIDGISLLGPTIIAESLGGEQRTYSIHPTDFGISIKNPAKIESGRDKSDNLREFIKFIAGQADEDINATVAMETAINLRGAGIVLNLADGTKLALTAIRRGDGKGILRDLVHLSDGDRDRFEKLFAPYE